MVSIVIVIGDMLLVYLSSIQVSKLLVYKEEALVVVIVMSLLCSDARL